MKADDQADFEVFMAKLQEKRRTAEESDSGGLGGRNTESSRAAEIADLDQPKAKLQPDAHLRSYQPAGYK